MTGWIALLLLVIILVAYIALAAYIVATLIWRRFEQDKREFDEWQTRQRLMK